MRLLRLELAAFGPFTDREIDLSGGEEGVHVVYGPNEAGKSSALRGLRALLFGIPLRTKDAFLHDHPRLVVRGVLERAGGETLAVERVKKRGETIRLVGDPDGRFYPDAMLQPWLGGVSEEVFCRVYGIDRDALVDGGQALASLRGLLDESLFAAALGGPRLDRVERALVEEAKDLADRRNSEFATTLKAHREAARRARDAAEGHNDYSDKLRRRDEVRGELEATRGRLREIEQEIAGRRRLTQVMGLLGRLRRTRDQLGDAASPDAPAILEREERILGLSRRIEVYVGARRDLASVGEELERVEESVASLRQAVPSPLGESAADLPGGSLLDGIRRTVDDLSERESVTGAPERLRGELADLERRRREVREALEANEEPGDPARLERLLRRNLTRAAREEERGKLRATARDLSGRIDRALRDLGRWRGGREELATFVLPESAVIEAAREAQRELEGARAPALEGRRSDLEARAAELEARIETLVEDQRVPTESVVTEAREARDASWEGIRGRWLDGGEPPAAAGGVDEASAADVAKRHEELVRAADDVVDRLRREATRSSQLTDALMAQRQLDKDRDRLARDEERLQIDRAALEDGWRRTWASAGIGDPGTPGEMLAWAERVRSLKADLAALEETERSLEETEQEVETYRQELEDHLEALGAEEAPDGETLLEMIERSSATVARLRDARQAREAERRTLAGLEEARRRAEAEIEAADAAAVGWRAEWAAAVAPLGLDAEATARDARAAIDRLQRLEHAMRSRDGLQGRVADMERTVRGFEEDTKALAEEVRGEVDLPAGPDARPERVAEALHSELLRAQEMARDRRSLRERLAETQEELDTLLAGRPVEEVIAEIGSRSREDLEAEVADLEGHRTEIAEEKARRDQELGAVGRELDVVDGNSRAAEAAEEAAGLQARLEELLVAYARVKLALRLLRHRVETYRSEHRDPLLARASELFARITAGAFSGLRVEADPGADGRSAIAAVRSSTAAPVLVGALSTATRDQLFLALRLAYLEGRLAATEPLPFVVDDIGDTFDDERALAALGALHEVSRKTQVIYFTHHEHQVEIARRAIPEGDLFVRRLPRWEGV